MKKNKIKNGTSFWWEKDKSNPEKSRRGRFRKLDSVKKLLGSLEKTSNE
ncbi:MAG TPA: hypothetical protein VMW41_06685 [Candidatus Bathyarchaeia archaeon]|nr:hypothetical protein [Candidatus Bathyarchaeia archaeon]